MHGTGHETDLMGLILESNLLNFVVVAAALVFLILKILPKSAKEHKEKLEAELKEAKEARLSAEKKLDELSKKLSGSDDELKKIVAQAEEMAAKIKDETLVETKDQIERMKDQAEKDIQAKQNSAIQVIKNMATKAAIALTEESVRQSTKDEKVLRNIQDKFVNDLEKQGASIN